MDSPTNPLVSKAELANTLRQLRTDAGKTLDEAADVLELSAATVSRIETGVRIPKARDVRELCHFYGVREDARIEKLVALVAGARAPGWWEEYSDVVDETFGTFIAMEGAATRIQLYENGTIPALLQTSAYQHAYFRDSTRLYYPKPLSRAEISRRVAVRIRRQELLSEDTPLENYDAIVAETVFDAEVGGRDVMRDQIQFLLDMMDHRKVRLRLLPYREMINAGSAGPFTILSLPQDQVSDAVYTDLIIGQVLDERDAAIAQHRRVFEGLWGSSLPTAESRQRLQSMLET